MVNLLPQKTRRTLSALYYSRFLSVLMFFAALAVFASAALLLPSYLRTSAEAAAANEYLTAAQKSTDRGSQGGVKGELAVFSEKVRILKTYPRPPEVARVLALLSAQVPSGVSVNNLTLTPGDAGKGKISISGKAATRSELLAFVSALQGVSAFSGVSVPVSVLASEANISFTLSFPFALSTS